MTAPAGGFRRAATRGRPGGGSTRGVQPRIPLSPTPAIRHADRTRPTRPRAARSQRGGRNTHECRAVCPRRGRAGQDHGCTGTKYDTTCTACEHALRVPSACSPDVRQLASSVTFGPVRVGCRRPDRESDSQAKRACKDDCPAAGAASWVEGAGGEAREQAGFVVRSGDRTRWERSSAESDTVKVCVPGGDREGAAMSGRPLHPLTMSQEVLGSEGSPWPCPATAPAGCLRLTVPPRRWSPMRAPGPP
jgi:hypothetical protein